jgi:hypothetical protein
MATAVGIFQKRADAEKAVQQLNQAGFRKDAVSILTSDMTPSELQSLPATMGEEPGMVKALGAVTGGAMGLSAAAFFVPGLGPLLAIGMAAGALIGSVAGGAMENFIFPGIPEQELYVYQDALRKGRTGVVVLAKDDDQVETARSVLDQAGAESIDRARHMWWLGVRDLEKEQYAEVGDFSADEPYFRQGFEAALQSANHNTSYEQYAAAHVRELTPQQQKAFSHGWERGLIHSRQQQKAA